MPTDNAAAWDRFAAAYQARARLPTDVASYGHGPGSPTEADLHLLGDLRGKRVLELGCGGAQSCIAFARAGATAIGVDFSAEQLAYGRRLCEEEKVRVELRLGDLADLAFLRADSIDLAFSAYTFHYVEDLNRVFRQVHRVLRVGAPLVFSLPHPASDVVDDDDGAGPAVVARSYFDREPIVQERDGIAFTVFHRMVSDLYMGLTRASYRVDLMLEPQPVRGLRTQSRAEPSPLMPRTLIIRARKEGN